MADVELKAQVYKDPRPKEHFDRYHRRVREHRPNWDYELVRTPNHFSFLDHFFLAVYLRRKVHFMAKSQLFKLPLWPFFNYGGVFPVRRGHADQEAFDTAHAILARGDVVVMYLEGGRSRTGELGTPRPGVGRLALETGVPVVPVAIVGSEKTRNWKRGQFPKVSVRFGAPVCFDQLEDPTRDQSQHASEQVFERIRGLWQDARDSGR